MMKAVKKMKLIDYVKNVSSIFPENETYYTPFDTADFRAQIVDYIVMAYSNLQIRPTLEEYTDGIPDLIVSLLNSKKYSYTRLWETTQLEYNPIENYNMVENGTDTENSESTANIGAQTNTHSGDSTTNYGESTTTGNNSTTYGKKIESGENTNTKSGNQTDSRYTVPYDTSEEQLVEKVKTDYSNIKDNATNKLTSEEHTDTVESTVTANAKTDTNTNNNTDTLGARSDSISNSNTTTHELKSTGNIGVTTSQRMIQAQRDVALFNFYSIVAHDIVKLITICIYD